MSINPTLDLHNEQHFKFAENTNSSGFCCCWKSQSNPREYRINDRNEFEGRRKCNYRERIQANQTLLEIIHGALSVDIIEADEAFEALKRRVNLSNGDPITDEKLAKVINEMHALKIEYSLRKK